ncbi:MAG: MFS transporter [Micromonosporaceae bacterium]|nr:MFS transporter [Micromonosporaceae bacterium]
MTAAGGASPAGVATGGDQPAVRWSVRGLRELWRRPGFGRLLTARLTSLAADGTFQASLASAVFFSPERATTAGQAAAGFAVLLLPYSLVGPLAGVWLDRWRRARVLVVSNLVRAVLVVATAGLLATGGPVGPVFFLTALAALSANRFHGAAAGAALPHVAAADRLVLANSVWTALGLVAGLAGAGVGLVIGQVLGASDLAASVAALLSAVIYIGSSLVAAGFAREALGPDHRVRRAAAPARRALAAVLRNLADGARSAVRRRQVAAGLAAIGVHRFSYGISTIATLLLYRNYFTDEGWLRAGLAGAAQVVAASALGAVAGSLITPVVVRRWSIRGWLVTLFSAAAVVQVVLGVPYRMAPLLAAAVVLGVVAQGAKICVEATVQRQVPDQLRGRVFSLYDTLFQATFVAAAVFAALSLPDTGKSYPVLAFVAAGYLAAAIGYAWATRPPRAALR